MLLVLALAMLAGGFALYWQLGRPEKKKSKTSHKQKENTTSVKQKDEVKEEPPKQANQGIAFAFSTVDHNIYKYDNGKVTRLTQGINPHYSPDGKQILFSRDINRDKVEDEIWVRELSTGKETKIANGCCADWLSDNAQTIFGHLTENGVSLIKKDLGSKKETKIKDNIPGLTSIDCSPSGTVLLEVSGGESESEIYSIKLDGSQYKKVAYGWKPSLSADNDKVVYCQNSTEPPHNISIFSYDLSTNSSKKITTQEDSNLYAPSYVDSNRLLYARQKNSGFEICVMDISTANVRVLQSVPSEVTQISVIIGA